MCFVVAYYHIHTNKYKEVKKMTQEAEKTGLKINIKKTKLLKVNCIQQAKVQKGKDLVTDKGGTDEDVKNRIGKAKHAVSI